MFAGHVGVGLAIARVERRVNLGLFVGAALLLDLVLWLFVLLGLESVAIPATFARTHQPEFVFPYSHGLLAGVVWSASAGAVALLALRQLPSVKRKVGVLVAAAVFSHWLLDVLVHRPEMPLSGAASSTFGLGLWNNMPVALAIEASIAAAGLYLFVSGSGLPRSKLIALTVLTLVILAFTLAGMTIAPPPPSALAMAVSSLVTIGVVCALFWWLGPSGSGDA